MKHWMVGTIPGMVMKFEMRVGLATSCAWLLLVAPAYAEESFPGQNNLAAGLACYRSLDVDCARMRLEKALREFTPERDKHYLQHVREARLVLALIYVSCENLDEAEKEFRTLLLLEPNFELPTGDHPPKIHYIFERAKEAILAQKTQAATSPRSKDKPESVVPKSPAQAMAVDSTSWSLSAEARLVGLFGQDAKKLSNGPGTALAVGTRITGPLLVELAFGYTYHRHREQRSALQVLQLGFQAQFEFRAGPVLVRTGLGLDALSMGTQDRYDHWGLVLRATAVAAWPPAERWAVLLKIHPSVVITSADGSFFLPVGLAGEMRW